MRLLLDECVPRKLKPLFVAAGHHCETVQEAGWQGKKNGDLLTRAELLFDVLITTDRNMRHQQNMSDRAIAILILRSRSNSMRNLKPLVPKALAALASIGAAQIIEIGSPGKES